MKNYMKSIFIFILCFSLVYGGFFVAKKYPKIFPREKNNSRVFLLKYIPSKANIIRVEIEVFDDTDKDFYDIEEVKFDDRIVKLQKANAAGKRARVYVQVAPGKYDLQWTVSKHKYKWPRSTEYKKQIVLTEKDKFAHIYIKGTEATITTS